VTSPEKLVRAKTVRVSYTTSQRVLASKRTGDTLLYEVTMLEGVPFLASHDTLHLRLARWRADTWFNAREPMNVAVTFGPASGTVIEEESLDPAKIVAATLLTVAVLVALFYALLSVSLKEGG
jgi:hypothetical protein